MTSSEIRQSFLDFFKSKQHTIVPSSSLMPDSPNPVDTLPPTTKIYGLQFSADGRTPRRAVMTGRYGFGT